MKTQSYYERQEQKRNSIFRAVGILLLVIISFALTYLKVNETKYYYSEEERVVNSSKFFEDLEVKTKTYNFVKFDFTVSYKINDTIVYHNDKELELILNTYDKAIIEIYRNKITKYISDNTTRKIYNDKVVNKKIDSIIFKKDTFNVVMTEQLKTGIFNFHMSPKMNGI